MIHIKTETGLALLSSTLVIRVRHGNLIRVTQIIKNGIGYKLIDTLIRIRAKSLGAGYAIGSKKVENVATVYNLHRLADISGNYYGAKAGATLIKGRYLANVKNNKGVTLGLVVKSKGPAIDFGAGLSKLSVKIISMRPVK